MTNPIGLTRQEEALEQPSPAAHSVAPPGAARCKVGIPPSGATCGAVATRLIVWPGEESDKTPACSDCASRMNAMAQAHRSSVRIEALT